MTPTSLPPRQAAVYAALPPQGAKVRAIAAATGMGRYLVSAHLAHLQRKRLVQRIDRAHLRGGRGNFAVWAPVERNAPKM